MTQKTPAAETAIDLCRNWAKDLEKKTAVKSFLFGSAIYQDGTQFDSERSDLDILCLIPSEVTTSLARFELMKELLSAKRQLELSMIPALGRTVCSEPGVSIVPLTEIELKGDIHKSGVGDFFRVNSFMNLITGDESFGMQNAGTISVRPAAAQAMAYSQKVRNDYLSVAANGTGGIRAYDGHDPLPKSLLRAAAQISNYSTHGQHFDVRLGLEEIHRVLLERRSEAPEISKLFDTKVSVRRGGRGVVLPLDAEDQLLLSEILFDCAVAVPYGVPVTWDMRVHGTTHSSPEVERIFGKIKIVCPDARLLGSWPGSVILRIVSSKEGFELLRFLSDRGVLGEALGIGRTEIDHAHEQNAPIKPVNYYDTRLAGVLQAIDDWIPKSTVDFEAEIELRNVIGAAIRDYGLHGDGYSIQTNPRIDITPMRSAPFDFLVHWFEGANVPELQVPIELKKFRSRSTVPKLLETYIDVGITTVLVIYDIPASELDDIQGQAGRTADINANLIFIFKTAD
ncbi:hypothetical protein FB552_3334 [Stenotrophomonas maltophilia]|nr:hypothetical protein FB552_3334 [Stenotrophomonas maltophilia]